MLSKMLSSLLAFFSVPMRDGVGITWASLRGGRATYMYLSNVPLEEIRWSGRWGSSRTMELYIQEVAGLSVLRHLPIDARHRVSTFAAALSPLIAEAASKLRSRVLSSARTTA